MHKTLESLTESQYRDYDCEKERGGGEITKMDGVADDKLCHREFKSSVIPFVQREAKKLGEFLTL